MLRRERQLKSKLTMRAGTKSMPVFACRIEGVSTPQLSAAIAVVGDKQSHSQLGRSWLRAPRRSHGVPSMSPQLRVRCSAKPFGRSQGQRAGVPVCVNVCVCGTGRALQQPKTRERMLFPSLLRNAPCVQRLPRERRDPASDTPLRRKALQLQCAPLHSRAAHLPRSVHEGLAKRAGRGDHMRSPRKRRAKSMSLGMIVTRFP